MWNSSFSLLPVVSAEFSDSSPEIGWSERRELVHFF